MEIGIIDYVIFGLGAFFLVLWLVFFFVGIKYNSMFEVLDGKEYRLKEMYGMGYAMLQFVKYGYKTNGDRKLRQYLSVLYEDKYADYYLRVVHSQQLTFAFTMIVISFALYGFANDISVVAVGIVFAFVLYYYFGTLTKKKIEKRTDELLHDFSEIVSKLALLTNAGMILREAWEEVAYAGDGVIYKEMQTSVTEMRNGVSDVDAMYNFGTRCIIPEVKKFTSTIMQGLTKGNSELTAMLQAQSKEVWQLKKQLVRREGEKAASKLLLPICVMFLGILIMIIVPIFTNIGM